MSVSQSTAQEVGVVVIGRNEGDRLRRCLESILPVSRHVVYVDSGSTDDSPAMARRMGVDVVDLDMSTPFCAARARNSGFERLIERAPEVRYVQFVDGDCELNSDWLPFATKTLEDRPDLAIVAGWLHERFPEASTYNRLGNVQWNTAGEGAGEVAAVGGIFMIRRSAFAAVDGFDPSVPAGEEPELCARLSKRGWRFLRADRDMALHDLAMTRFSQWWRRQIRSGYGSMDVARRFGLRQFQRNNMRVVFWSIWLMGIVAGGIWLVSAASVRPGAVLAWGLLASAWPLQVARITYRIWRRDQPLAVSATYGLFLMLSFWPQALGLLMYWNDRLHKRTFRLVEYKAIGGTGRGAADRNAGPDAQRP
jgi:GT2 family glycosyltransferase